MTTQDFSFPFTVHEDPILIRSNREPYGWMGNMSAFPVTHEGREYRTTEALFQALRVSDEGTRELIRAEKSPMGAKLKAKSLAHMRTTEPLSTGDLDLMRVCLRLKIKQHPQLRYWLIQTGSLPIIEACSKRQHGTGLFWGAASLGGRDWTGLNKLGVLWEELRAELSRLSVGEKPATTTEVFNPLTEFRQR